MAETVLVALSGGVDSSVAAALLLETGYHVVAVTLNFGLSSSVNSKPYSYSDDGTARAERIASQLNIPFINIDASQLFSKVVINYFVEGYSSGHTPNPCVICNRWIKWEVLLKQAQTLGAQWVATGHYARIRIQADGGCRLQCGKDASKDQVYFLSNLTQNHLRKTIFPVGDYRKIEVRELARKYGLESANQKESQDLCFLGDQDYRDFLVHRASSVHKPGKILSITGDELGWHDGLAFYSIGQRKGLKVSSAQPLYVLEKIFESNVLIVGPEKLLGRREFTAADMNWISGKPPNLPCQLQVKIRYRAPLVWATVSMIDDRTVKVVLEKDLRDITPGQFAVFYQENYVLGGGQIL